MANSYEAKDIQVLEGLEAVRLRPGMYIGTTGINGLHHILWEIVDNAIDEAANGYATKIWVTLKADGSCEVSDNGRGIPVDMHPKLKKSGVEIVFTKLHAGGKFSDKNYNYSGGLHGVGASVTNALSRWLEVTVYKKTKEYFMRFETEIVGKKIKCGIPVDKLIERKSVDPKRSGSTIRFMPDDRVFTEIQFNYKVIAQRLKELAFLNKGVYIKLTDERKLSGADVIENEYQFNGGLVDFIGYLNQTNDVLFDKPIYFSGEKDGILAEITMQYTDSYVESIFSFVNNIPTTEGGTHEIGFKSGLTKVFNDYAKKVNILKDKDIGFVGDDFRVGMTAIISVKMKNVQFEGQTKTKLGNPEAKNALDAIVSTELNNFLESRGSGKIMDVIMGKAKEAMIERDKIKRAKDLARAKNSLDVTALIGKLASCSGRDPAQNELFIVEGDSAGGTAKSGRDRKTQAILPLRGKPLNVEKKSVEKVLENEEIRMIITALGAGIGDDFDVNAINYHKVIILSDADQDGLHIRCILLTFFYRYMRDLIVNGNVYIGQPPLYKISKGDKVVYAYDEIGLRKATSEFGKGYAVQRYKGLGEMNADQLRDTTMSAEHRLLVRVTIEDAFEAERMISILMGESKSDKNNQTNQRKAYIFENANFNKVDNFKPTQKN